MQTEIYGHKDFYDYTWYLGQKKNNDYIFMTDLTKFIF
jgi:hypothetical protein